MEGGTWKEVHGRWYLEGGAWKEVYGRRYMEGGTWKEVHGRGCMEGGAWKEAHGRRNSWDLWSNPWGSNFPAPSNLFEQNFGLGIRDEDLFPPTLFRGWYVRPRRQRTVPQQTGASMVSIDEKEFKVNLDVTHFKPEEIGVKAMGNRVIIEGKHEEKEDEHGSIQRYFKRTYMLPRDVDPDTVKSILSADGVLTITAPKREVDTPDERQITVELAGSGDATQ
ncbi:Protein lethal(2)essential for life [Lamellibrachia satsuma]|nr:Protein lethal(2)essential for life [Lamellibrachia satsuma]